MPVEQLAAGCRAPGFFDGMNLWREWVINFFPRVGDSMCRAMGGASNSGVFPDWLIFLIIGAAGGLLIVNVAALGVPFTVWLERRLLGRFQQRLGPNRVGKFGLLQPFADAMKLMTKEDVTSHEADKIVFTLAPLAFVVPVFLMFAVLPWAENTALADPDVGILFIIAVTTAAEFGIFMAGWSANNKYTLFGAMRAVALLVSYEVPLLMAVAGIVVVTGTMQMSGIVEAQRFVPNIAFQPLGFLIFIVAISAELNRAPFDLLEAESELVTGFHTEYSGMKWAIVQMAEYAAIIGFSGVIAALFLSGWKGPFILPGYIWFLLKIGFVISAFIWVRATIPRLRVDQIMALGWKFLLPLALVNLFVMAVEVVAYPGGLPEWLIPVNIAIAGIALVTATRLTKFPGDRRKVLVLRGSIITPDNAGHDPAPTGGI